MPLTVKKSFIFWIGLILIVAGGFYIATSPPRTPLATYTNDEFDFIFGYPNRYTPEVKEVGTGERRHTAIILAEPMVEGQLEGSPAVTIDIYQNDLDKLDVVDWIKNTSASNYKLGNGNIDIVEHDQFPMYGYSWDGLYRGATFAFSYGTNIYAFSATYIEQSDQTLKALATILATLQFREP